MKNYKLFVSSIFAALALVIGVSPAAQAQGVQDFVITDFRVDYQLTNNDPQGTLRTKEAITVDFSGQNRGILRAIPERNGTLKTNPVVSKVQRDGKNEPFITYSENENTVIRIGDVDTYITGEHTYLIEYEVENVIRFFETHDELYWNVNGTQWLQPFENIVATIETTAPTTTEESLKPICFTGSFGATEKACEINEATGKLTVSTTETLLPGETLTFIQAYEKGYFTPPTWLEKHWTSLLGAAVVLSQLLVFYYAYKKWRKYGKDYSRGIVTPYFERPKGVSLIEAGYVSTQQLQPVHLTAALIDLAIRGYVTITETNDKKPKHELTLIKDIDASLAADEAYLLEHLFDSKVAGATVRLEDKKQKLHPILTSLKAMADTATHKKGFFELQPSKGPASLTKYYLLSIVTIVIGFITAPASYGLGVVIGILVFIGIIILGSLMAKRSRSGMYLKEHMDGLKLYLSRSEKDRLKAHDAVAAPLAPRSAEPKRTVAFFEKLLPFAIALGVEKSWAEAFKDIYQQAPDWYQGNWSSFNTVALANSLSSTASVASVSFSAPASSGSGSGFSGGSAGGGGGGGGGGGW